MGTSAASATRAFVGRTSETGRVRSVVEGARECRMGALLVSGDAGVGKTRLVEHACAGAGRDVVVLTGVCLPMGATTVPLMPLRTAFRRLPDGIRPPELGPVSGHPAGGTPVVVDEWLDRLCDEHPVVLVVDDIHWADPGSLDVLTYLLAAPADRRLAVVMTLRRGEVGVGHPLQRWLADVRRMPCLTELPLSSFDRAGTSEQLHALLGAVPHESLVTEVHTRTGGNAYLNRLLVEDLPSDTRHLGDGLPDDLRSAVLRPWHRLSEQARGLVLAVALGGEVASGAALRRAVDLAGTPPVEAPLLLREAVDSGVLDVTADGGYWFHHPLQAEALESGVAGEERRRLHAALARACEADLAGEAGPPTPSRLAATAAVAEHHLRAEHHEDAYRWTMRAADLAGRLDDQPVRLTLLRRLVDLRDHVEDVEPSRVEVLGRLWQAAAEHGDHEAEFGAVEALLAEVDERTDALEVAELLVRREHLRFSTGRGFLRVEPVRHAAELTRRWPDSWQHGYALAEVAHASLWADDPGAQDAVADAVAHADRTGHPRVTAYAYAAAAMGAEFANRPGSNRLAAVAVSAATRARDWWAFVHATLWEANGSDDWGTSAWSLLVEGRRRQLESLAAPHPYLAWLSASEAGSLLGTGDWRGCAERLRVALGSDPGVGAVVTARLTAARLAVLQGRQHEAEDHLSRADELFADTTGFLAFEFDAVRAQVRLGADDAEGAYTAAMAGALSPGVPPTLCEWLCPLAARALADLAEAARADGRPPGPVLERLDALVDRWPHVIADNAYVDATYRGRLEPLDALYDAEVSRARRSDDRPDRWLRAARLLDGVWPWDAAYATYRAGEAALVGGGRAKDEAAALLRRAHSLACALGAEPVLDEVVALARSARIALDEVRPTASEPVDDRLHGLTVREREILDHVVAGRTYGEIARALFVSEKTVSSHLSNMLRKTGAANRVELAGLARHHGTTPAEPPG